MCAWLQLPADVIDCAPLAGAQSPFSVRMLVLNDCLELHTSACGSRVRRCAWVQLAAADVDGALMADALSPFGVRVLVLDICLELQLLVCGDRMGNITAFSLPQQALNTSGERPWQLQREAAWTHHACIILATDGLH